MCINLQRDGDILNLVLDAPGKSANLLDREFTSRFSEVLGEIDKEKSFKGILVRSAKKDFLAGADLTMMLEAQKPDEVMEWLTEFKDGLRKLETLG